MGTRESSAPSTQGVALEIQEKEERILDEKEWKLMTTCKGGSVDMVFEGNRLAESGKATSFSGNSGDGASQSAASRDEDSSDECGDTNQDFSATQQQMLNQMHQEIQDGAIQNAATMQYSGTNTNLRLPDFGMGLNVSGGQALPTKEDHEQRKEKRKQSNRESAKRSRFRRQQEYEGLQETAKMLQSRISKLADKLWRLSKECVKLKEENNSIIDELEKTYGPDAVFDLKDVEVDSFDGESKNIEPKTPSRDKSTPDTSSKLRANFADILKWLKDP